MTYTPISRLQVYTLNFSKYDLKDKYLSFNPSIIRHFETSPYCVISSKINSNINETIFNEFLTFKRTCFRKTRKLKRTLCCTTTLRKKVFFLCLELLLNSNLITSKLKLLTINSSMSSFSIPTTSNSNYFFNFSYMLENHVFLSNTTFNFNKNYKFSILQNCFFLPTNF